MEKLEKANTPLEQIYKNTENIYKLSQYVKPLYNAKIDLSNDTEVVDVSDTNLTEDVEKALIIDINGNLYNFVAFNEDKTKAYITFYSNIQGPQGEQGESGAADIDDTTTAADKIWSSQKTNNEISQIKSIGVIYSTTATPTQDNDTYIFNKTDFITEPLPNWSAIIGKQICQIVDSKIKYIYSVVASNATTITCVLIGEVGGGSQLYQHNITLKYSNRRIVLNIINTDSTQFTKLAMCQWLYNNGFVDSDNLYLCGGYTTDDSGKQFFGCYNTQNTINFYCKTQSTFMSVEISSANWTIVDHVITL